MARPPEGDARRPGLPDPHSVVATAVLTSPQAAATPSAGPAGAAGEYRILRTREIDPYDAPIADAEIPAFGVPAAVVPGDNFQGTARKAAKLSFADAETENFADVRELIGSLPEEEAMIHHQPEITTDALSERVTEEERNVRVRAFIYAASRETDNDFHLIVGRDPSLSPPMYMTTVGGPSPATRSPKLGAQEC
jgi:hypothetical protein